MSLNQWHQGPTSCIYFLRAEPPHAPRHRTAPHAPDRSPTHISEAFGSPVEPNPAQKLPQKLGRLLCIARDGERSTAPHQLTGGPILLLRSTCGGRWTGPTHRTPASRSTSVGTWKATTESSPRYRPSTCALEAR